MTAPSTNAQEGRWLFDTDANEGDAPDDWAQRLEEVENMEDNAEATDNVMVVGENAPNRRARFSEANNSTHTFTDRSIANNEEDNWFDMSDDEEEEALQAMEEGDIDKRTSEVKNQGKIQGLPAGAGCRRRCRRSSPPLAQQSGRCNADNRLPV